MEIRLRFVGVAPSDAEIMTSEVERRVNLALDRLADRVREVHVSLADVNGPRGGVDQRCVLTITPRYGGDPVVVRALEETREAAVQKALKRVRRRLEHAFERQRGWARPPQEAV